MAQYTRVERQIICDVCGTDCHRGHDNEFAELRATWGYDSNKDLTEHRIDICETCFDRTIEFLKSIRTAPVKTDSDALEGYEYGPA